MKEYLSVRVGSWQSEVTGHNGPTSGAAIVVLNSQRRTSHTMPAEDEANNLPFPSVALYKPDGGIVTFPSDAQEERIVEAGGDFKLVRRFARDMSGGVIIPKNI